jgi:hypothetical protein
MIAETITKRQSPLNWFRSNPDGPGIARVTRWCRLLIRKTLVDSADELGMVDRLIDGHLATL